MQNQSNMKIFSYLLIALSLIISSCKKDKVKSSSIDGFRLCQFVNSDQRCEDNVSSFTTSTPQIYAALTVNDGKDDDYLTFTWTYASDQYEIDELTVRLGDLGSGKSIQVAGSLSRPNAGWPSGSYEVKAALTGGVSVTRTFTIQ